ncbi:hypothetical protein [Winogradskyella ludwigii]|jgi:hypothetical protein|uniref:hypothetical protein n=1 Tax=Winogradskyella ludwigii TaxID=2686076 RepID=UPI0015CBF317|nr:hypothetical protein [Winogradskyella ludwigii]
MKTILLFFVALITTNLFAQKTFFENLEDHGDNITYLEYGSIGKLNDGTTYAQGSGEEVKIKIRRHQNIPCGLEILSVSEDGEQSVKYWQDMTKQTYIDLINYPLTSINFHNGYYEGYVAIGNYVFFLKDFKSKTEFGEIRRVYVLKGTTPDGVEPVKKKKKKFGKFLNKVKNVALNTTSEEDYTKAPEYKALMSQDNKKMITDYLVAMKAKEAAHTTTAKEEADLELVKAEGKKYAAYIKSKNDAYWQSPEGQKTLRGWKLADEHKASCPKTAESCGSPFH